MEGGKARGLQVAAYLNGKLIVDAWSGFLDPEKKRPVNSDSLFPVFSTTKGIAATAIHLLAEKKKLSYDTIIADLWPGFGSHGKGSITLKHVLNHSAGLQNIPLSIGISEACDMEKISAAMAECEPSSPPGKQAVYHAVTYGWILAEVIRRVDGRPFSRFLLEDIARPLGVEAMYVGIPEGLEERIAVLEDPEFTPPASDPNKPEAIPGWMWPLHALMNRPDFQRTCMPATNGIMSAHAVARHYASLLPGGVDGVRLLSEDRLGEAIDPANAVFDPANPPPSAWALGYNLSFDANRRVVSFGHGGFGGSNGFAEPQTGLAVGFSKNLFGKNSAGWEVLEALKKAL